MGLSLFVIFMCCLVQPIYGKSPSSMPQKPKKSDQKLVYDPLLTTLEGKLSFDEETKKALIRSKIPGVLLGDKEEPNNIYRIIVSGAKKVEPDAILLRLLSKINHPFNPVLVAEDVQEIFKMGLFADVKVLYNILPSGAVELKYELLEIPTIFQIKIAGNEALGEDEIKESIAGLENYHVAKPSRLNEYADKIKDFYVSKGYYLASVKVETKPTSEQDIKNREEAGFSDQSGQNLTDIDTANVMAPDFVDVIFTVQENSMVKISRIAFLGNYHLADDLLKSQLHSQQSHLLSVVTDWGTFRKDYLEFDALILEKILHDHGFLKAKVLAPEVELSDDKSLINITYRIEENDQYRLGVVEASGDLVERSEIAYRIYKESHPDEARFLAKKLESLVEQKEGDVFNKSLMADNVLTIAEKYRDKGYAYVNVSPIPVFHDEEKTVDIHIAIESGPKVKIERIDIEGNEKTKDEVIRRELVVFEGDFYSSSLLRLSEQNLLRLGYFETVEFITNPGSAADTMVVTIKVKEQSTGNIQAGAGYGTGGEGVILRAQLSNQNLFGRGQTLSATVNWSNYRRMFDVSFIEPYVGYIFDSPLLFAFTAYNRDMSMGEFNRKATGGDITFGYPLGGPFAHISRKWKQKASPGMLPYVFDFEALSFLLTYTVERVEINNFANAARIFDLHQGVPRYTTSLKPAIKLDQRDNRMFPSRGYYVEFRTEFASRFLGAEALSKLENHLRKSGNTNNIKDGLSYKTPEAEGNNFIRYGANFRFYHNLDDWFFLKGLVFKTNLEIGLLNTLGKPLLFENYALGGSNSVRGYGYRTISPAERVGALYPFDPRQAVFVGGNKQIYGSFELEFPIIKALKLSGVLFFDFGNVYSPEDNFFFIGGKSSNAALVKPADPLGIYGLLGLYTSAGFGVRWLSPLGYLRFEWGFPLNPRPSSTPGLIERDPVSQFEFAIGPSF